MSQTFLLESVIQPGEHPACIAFVNQFAVVSVQDQTVFNVAFGVVKEKTCLRVYAAYRANHLGREQHVFHRYDGVEQIDTGLVVNAGIEINIVEQMFF